MVFRTSNRTAGAVFNIKTDKSQATSILSTQLSLLYQPQSCCSSSLCLVCKYVWTWTAVPDLLLLLLLLPLVPSFPGHPTSGAAAAAATSAAFEVWQTTLPQWSSSTLNKKSANASDRRYVDSRGHQKCLGAGGEQELATSTMGWSN